MERGESGENESRACPGRQKLRSRAVLRKIGLDGKHGPVFIAEVGQECRGGEKVSLETDHLKILDHHL